MSRDGFSGARVRHLRLALVTAVCAVSANTHAEAALFYWQDAEPAFSQYQPTFQPRQHRLPHRPVAKKQAPERETGPKPQAPLIIAISIDKQRLKLYDANGFFAEAPVSTGMRGHPTPMGVFSVIQKQKWHRSNIYSGAPMPYMQRITWSGVAMHAGVLPGYPASHGCIRMPTSFAIKMWNWTKMGARVIVTPGEVTPAPFSHPLLASFKVPPSPVAAGEPDMSVPRAAKADKAAPESNTTELKLRSTNETIDFNSAPDREAATGALREQTRTADASAPPSENKNSLTASDASKVSAKDAEGAKEKNSEPARSSVELQPSKDQTRMPGADKSPAVKAEPHKRAGQISVFISRKDSRIYVRQNFAPLFSAAVTIAPSERPFGTHIFTAEVDQKDPNAVHWTVVSLPVTTRRLPRELGNELASRHGVTGPVVVQTAALPVQNNPAEALDRISVPAETMAHINEALSTGGSIIVSDQGINQGETGEGTDFIVSLR